MFSYFAEHLSLTFLKYITFKNVFSSVKLFYMEVLFMTPNKSDA